MRHWTEFLENDGPDGAYLPWKKVEPRVGISRTTAWRLQKSGDFPKPYVVSPGRVAYRESEVEAWKMSRGHRSAETLRAASPRRSRQEELALAPEPPTWESLPAAAAPDPALVTVASLQLPRRRPKAKRAPPNTEQMRFQF